MKYNVITISREFGAGGGELAKKLSDKLKIEYYDKAIILQAAKSSNIDMSSVMKWDEKVSANFGFTQSLFDFYNRPLDEKLFNVQKDIIRKYAEKEKCIILGRNANWILKEYDKVLHIFVHAPKEFRFNRMRSQIEGTDDHVMAYISHIDKQRAKYCKYYTNTVYGQASNYDLTFNTSEIDIDTCVDIIYNLVKD